ncbi:MAG: hypothetical protein ACT4P9_07615 [Betaproteobacteria bacterium]
MQSLLSSMQSWLEAPRPASYGGRFVALAIARLSPFDPSIATSLLHLAGYRGDLRGKAWHIDVEFGFQRRGRRRRADLAIFEVNALERPVCLVEIKYDDQESDRNAAQFSDYVGYCAKHEGTAFLCLTQYYIPRDKRPEELRECLFSDFADTLEVDDQKFSPTSLLVDYFRERGLTMEQIDPGALGRLMHRLFNPRGGGGRQQKNRYMIHDIPEVFRTVMSNVSVFGSEISRNLRIRRVPVIDFETAPWVRPDRVLRRSARRGTARIGKPLEVRNRERAGGVLYAFAQSYLRGGARSRGTIGIDYGYHFDIEPGKKTKCALYGSVWGEGIAMDTESESRMFFESKLVGTRVLNDRAQCVSTISDQLCIAARSAIKRKETTKSTKQVLRRLVSSLKDK